MVATGWRRRFLRAPLFAFVLAALAFPQTAPKSQRQPILAYIKQTWAVLTRSNRTLASAAADPKFQPSPNGHWPVYLPRGEDVRKIRRQLRQEMAAADFEKIELRRLPENLDALREQGLL